MSDPNLPPGSVPPGGPTPPPPGSVPPPVDYGTPATAGSGGLFGMPPRPMLPVPPEHRTLGMLCHLLALAGFIVPFGNIVGPLVMWLIKKDQMPFVDDQGKESLNFQITITIAAIVLGIVTICVLGIGGLLVAVAGLVLSIVGAVAASKGEYYRYPFSMRLIK